MPVILALLLGVAGFIWWSWGRDRAGREVANRMDGLFRRRPACRWAKTGDGVGTLHEYRCETCGVAAYGSADGPPKECKRSLKGGL